MLFGDKMCFVFVTSETNIHSWILIIHSCMAYEIILVVYIIVTYFPMNVRSETVTPMFLLAFISFAKAFHCVPDQYHTEFLTCCQKIEFENL
jgi:hypothetical protein